MRDTVRLGRIAGIPIGVNWSVLAVAAYLFFTLAFGALPRWWPSADLNARLMTGAGITVLFFASILGHELGHAAAARRHGVEVEGITLWVLGGIAKLRRQAPTPRAEFDIAAAGPAVSLLLGVGFAGAALGIDRWSTWGLAASAASWLAITNAFLGLTNLIPIAPLDGGRVLTAALWRSSNDAERARLISARAGLLVGAGVVLGSAILFVFADRFGWWLLVLSALTGVFIAHAAWREIIGAVIRSRLSSTLLADVMISRPATVPDDMSVETFVRSTDAGQPGVARPVVRWGHDPIGYVNPYTAETISGPERSWTPIHRVMIPVDQVDRGWRNETVADFVARSDDRVLDAQSIVVIHDHRDGQPIGTLTPYQIDPLFAAPNAWGQSATTPPPPKVPGPIDAHR